MPSVEENLEKLTAAWLAEGRPLPLLYPMEVAQIRQYARRHGISDAEMLEVMRTLVERHEQLQRDEQWIQMNFRSN